MTCCAAYVSFPVIKLCNDPLKRDRQITMVPRRATQSCKILSVRGLLSQITCPSDVFGHRWRTSYATQQAQQCVNVRRVRFMRCESDRGERRGGRRCVCVCLYGLEFMILRGPKSVYIVIFMGTCHLYEDIKQFKSLQNKMGTYFKVRR